MRNSAVHASHNSGALSALLRPGSGVDVLDPSSDLRDVIWLLRLDDALKSYFTVLRPHGSFSNGLPF